jgi:hypothetical protein
MKNYMDNCIVCPFYSHEDKLKLHCEGYCKGTRLHLLFDCKERMKAHKKRFCDNINGYMNCPLYPVIEKQYKKKGDEDE